MTEQRQSVGAGGTAIQSRGDTVINTGITPANMREILDALAAQLPTYAAMARELVDSRLADLEERILRKFVDPQAASPDAFKDPDFQYLLGRAQHAYARSGDSLVADTLVDLVARRSKEDQRNRLALTLNDAVETVAVLTRNEFAELALCYLLGRTINHGILSMAAFVTYGQTCIDPLVPDISNAESSYQYLDAHGCASLAMQQMFAPPNVVEIFRRNYAGLFSRGFDLGTLEQHLPDGKKNVFVGTNMLIPCMNDPAKVQLNCQNKEAFEKLTAPLNLDEGLRNSLWAMFEGTVWSGEEFVSNVSAHWPGIRPLIAVWNSTPVGKMNLTTAGIAIGHAYLKAVSNFEADLSIWIR